MPRPPPQISHIPDFKRSPDFGAFEAVQDCDMAMDMRRVYRFVGMAMALLVSSAAVSAGDIDNCRSDFRARNFDAAYYSCLEATGQGHVDAGISVGLMFAVGAGVERDCGAAVVFLRRAVRNNNSTNEPSVTLAKEALGQLYGGSPFVCPELRNLAMAEMWYFLAYASSGPSGLAKLDAIERKMGISPAEISDGRKWAQTWLRSRRD